MKYSELIQFEPVEGVVKVRQADERATAEQLVRTYVISDRMADVILHRILPTLTLERSEESGGLFVVGNYGTGKSHLMSLLSAVAEHADLAEQVTHPAVAAGLRVVAGKFQVVRQEFGSSTMPLRNIVLQYLQEGLAKLGVEVRFPGMDEAPNTKDLLTDAMRVFEQKYPGQGLLVVIDELLEYLMGRNERELILDLAFLREVGETCSQSNLRFIAGLQESLFDSPRFQFAADSIRRVRDRYQQVRIVREDVAFVVARRLLAKSDAQRRKIRAYLEQFALLYELMAERMDEFVDLFPVHPAYLEIFERVTVIEKRQALRAVSQEMRRILNENVPEEYPGLISFDSFWRLIQENPDYRATPEIREVLERSQVLEERVRNTLNPLYCPAALRVIHALALHRLTTGDLRAPIGLTPKELRDRLCLHLPVPEAEAAFLLTSVENVLQEISRAVSGQFLSHNRENDQYYLDLDKNVDFDALIEQRAAVLDNDTLDRYYFDALGRSLELSDTTYKTGFRIWQIEIPWPGHGITRDGYIFLGTRDERSTTHPERDFYIHFTHLFKPNGQSNPEPHELFFSLTTPDEMFKRSLRLYAGAREMAALSSGSNKAQYERKAENYLNALSRWLRENFDHAFTVAQNGISQSMAERKGQYRLLRPEASLRDQVIQLAAAMLSPIFERAYPEYPAFPRLQLSLATLPQACQAALRALAGGPFNQQAQSVLEGLELIKWENGQPHFDVLQSRYAQHILGALQAVGEGRVLNRADLMEAHPRRLEREKRFGLEPPLLVVVLAALLRQGEATLTWMGRTFGSDDLNELARQEVEDLTHFSAIARPKPLPEQSLKALFDGLGLPAEWITDPSQHERAAQEVTRLAGNELPRLAMAIDSLREGLRYAGQPILSTEETQTWRKSLETYRSLLEILDRMNTPGRLRQFPLGVGEVRAALKGRETLGRLNRLRELLQSIQPHLTYLTRAELRLPVEHPWQEEMNRARQQHLTWLRDPVLREDPALYSRLNGSLSNLRAAYAQAYLALHNQARLDRAGDERKRTLTQDLRWRQLFGLQDVHILPGKAFEKLKEAFNALRACPNLTLADLNDHTECPHCGFDPRTEALKQPAIAALEDLENELSVLHADWLSRLRAELSKPEAEQTIPLLKSPYREQIETFVQEGRLPDSISKALSEAINDALSGLEKVTIDGTVFLSTLTKGGMPCSVEELYARFDALMENHLKGKNRNKVRIEIDW